MKTLQRGAAAATIALSLGGCMAVNVQTFNPIDNADRTVSVPADDSALIGAIKQRLQRIGWRLIVEGDATQPGVPPSAARYRLAIRQAAGELCYPKGGPEVNFSLMLMDNKTKDAVMTADGRDCTDAAADKFIAAVRRAGRR